jgi:hypothetical protein
MSGECEQTEQYYLLGYNAAYSVESQMTFRRNMSSSSSGSKNKPSKKPASKAKTDVKEIVVKETDVGGSFI